MHYKNITSGFTYLRMSIPAVGRLLWHQNYPMSHHTQCPLVVIADLHPTLQRIAASNKSHISSPTVIDICSYGDRQELNKKNLIVF
jgi:hypothetical protein